MSRARSKTSTRKKAARYSPLIRANTSTIGAMRIADVAPELLISESMVRRLIDRGELHAACIGKRKIIFREDLEAFKARLRGIEPGAEK